MLAHSPPLPLTVDYYYEDHEDDNSASAKDEQGLLLALEQRHRVRHIRLFLLSLNPQKLIMAIDEEFPILEYLIVNKSKDNTAMLVLSETLQAPHLRHLTLGGFTCPIRPRLHLTATGLVTLVLLTDHQFAYFQPNSLLQWISFLPQLETLDVAFTFPVPSRDVERQLTHTQITTHTTLPNLRTFGFQGVSAYLEVLVCRITTPRLETLQIRFFNQLTFSVPHLLQFMNATETLRFNTAQIMFKDKEFSVGMFFHGAAEYAFVVMVDCCHLDWQVSSVTQISNAHSQVLSVVEHLTLEHKIHSQSSEEHNAVDRIEWRNLLRSFSNVKTLRVENGLVEELSQCLRLEDGELPLEILPELQELTYFGSGDTGDGFTSFVDARRDAGRPVTLVRHSPKPSPLSTVPPAIAASGDEAGNDVET